MAYETREERVAALSRVKMPHGKGGLPPNGKLGSMCVMECVAWVDGTGPLSDSPVCASPILTRFAIAINDGGWWESNAERTEALMPLVVLLAGSRDESREQARAAAIKAWVVGVRVDTACVRGETAAKRLAGKWPEHAAKRLAGKWPEHAAKISAAVVALRAEPTRDNMLRLRDVARAAAAAYAAAAAADAAAAAAYAARKQQWTKTSKQLIFLLKNSMKKPVKKTIPKSETRRIAEIKKPAKKTIKKKK